MLGNRVRPSELGNALLRIHKWEKYTYEHFTDCYILLYCQAEENLMKKVQMCPFKYRMRTLF
jgi:hypothetical protein